MILKAKAVKTVWEKLEEEAKNLHFSVLAGQCDPEAAHDELSRNFWAAIEEKAERG